MVRILTPKTLSLQLLGFKAKNRLLMGRAIQKAGVAFRDHTKKMRPVSGPRDGYGARGIPVDTGILRKQIKKRKISMMAAGVFGGAKYTKAVHDGKAGIPARPFFTWSLKMGGYKKMDRTIIRSMRLLP